MYSNIITHDFTYLAAFSISVIIGNPFYMYKTPVHFLFRFSSHDLIDFKQWTIFQLYTLYIVYSFCNYILFHLASSWFHILMIWNIEIGLEPVDLIKHPHNLIVLYRFWKLLNLRFRNKLDHLDFRLRIISKHKFVSIKPQVWPVVTLHSKKYACFQCIWLLRSAMFSIAPIQHYDLVVKCAHSIYFVKKVDATNQ